jgi:dihydrofolate reductase
MPELLVDFICSLDGYAAAEDWPGWWGLEGPEYLAWLGEQPEADYTILMCATTYRLMSGFAADGEPGIDALADMSKVVFSTTLREPFSWANTRLETRDPVEAVREMKQSGSRSMRTIGSLTLCRSILKANVVDRFRVVVFPVIYRSERTRADLRRLSRRCPRHDQRPHVRWSNSAAGVRPYGSGRSSGNQRHQSLTIRAGTNRGGVAL